MHQEFCMGETQEDAQVFSFYMHTYMLYFGDVMSTRQRTNYNWVQTFSEIQCAEPNKNWRNFDIKPLPNHVIKPTFLATEKLAYWDLQLLGGGRQQGDNNPRPQLFWGEGGWHIPSFQDPGIQLSGPAFWYPCWT